MCVCVCVCVVVVVVVGGGGGGGGGGVVVACTESGKHVHLRESTFVAIHKHHYAAVSLHISTLYINPVCCISV